VVEAARNSGSLITARFAADQNREVFAVPGSPLDPRAEGANDLLRDGARLCARVEDVLNVLDPVRAQDPFAIFREDPPETSEPLWGELPLLGVDPEMAPRARPAQALDEAAAGPFGLSEDDATAEVERLLGPSPITLDELAEVSGLPLKQVRMAVTMLDLAGRIEHSGGDRVALLAGE
jgi:DNA processing protein